MPMTTQVIEFESTTVRKVLIVDDEPEIRKILKRAFNKYVAANPLFPIEVLESDGRYTARDILQQKPVDFVVIDLMMMSEGAVEGANLIAEIEESPFDCGIGVLSALDQRELLEERVLFYFEKDEDRYETKVVEQVIAELLRTSKKDLEKELPQGKTQPLFRTTVTFTIPHFGIYTDVLSEGDYVKIIAPDMRQAGQIGEPMLPEWVQWVALPFPTKSLSIQLEDEIWRDEPGTVRVLPVPAPYLEGQEPVYQPDEEVYSRSDFFPDSIVGIQERTITLDGMPCATVWLRPMQYNPKTQTLKVLQAATLRIEGVPTSPNTYRLEPDRASLLQNSIIHWKEMASGATQDRVITASAGATHSPDLPVEPDDEQEFLEATASEKRRYWAIGTRDCLDAIQPLLDKRKHKYKVKEIVLGTNIPVNQEQSPSEKAQVIKDFLRKGSRKASEKPTFVLFVGDHGDIPYWYYDQYNMFTDEILKAKLGSKSLDAIQGIPIQSDSWYAFFPTPVDDEQEPESENLQFVIGRLPYSDPDKLHDYCSNHFGNQTDQPGWNPWLFFSGPGKYSKEVKDLFKSSLTRPHLNGVRHKSLEGIANASAHITDHLQEKPTLVTYRGHGLRTEWSAWNAFTSSHIPPITQRFHGIISSTCCTGTMDTPGSVPGSHPGCGSCTQAVLPKGCNDNPAFGLTWIEQSKSPWFFGATRKAESEKNLELLESIVRILTTKYGSQPVAIGEILREALGGFATNTLTVESARRDNFNMYVLIGDPAWEIPSP